MGERDKKLEALGYPLNDIPGPGAIYKPVVVHGTTVYVSGAVPVAHGKLVSPGKVPSQVSVEEAQRAAALCAANNLRMVIQELGSLDRIARVLRVTGYVNSDLDFTEPHVVVNGASQLLIDVFGPDAGVGARSAIGMAQLPRGASTEIEMILELKP
ncbi:MAG: RidA family protein [Rhodothermales bacterium]|nr:RidA family protein [Rhodothermales bacterium]